jgi:hypothetical protein
VNVDIHEEARVRVRVQEGKVIEKGAHLFFSRRAEVPRESLLANKQSKRRIPDYEF